MLSRLLVCPLACPFACLPARLPARLRACLLFRPPGCLLACWPRPGMRYPCVSPRQPCTVFVHATFSEHASPAVAVAAAAASSSSWRANPPSQPSSQPSSAARADRPRRLGRSHQPHREEAGLTFPSGFPWADWERWSDLPNRLSQPIYIYVYILGARILRLGGAGCTPHGRPLSLPTQVGIRL